MLYLFAATLFVSAALLFWIQPLFSKMVLPLLGGTPGVWNTCMVFYQAALLAGYASAHALLRWLGVKRQAILHCVLLGVGFFFLPISLSFHSEPPTNGQPAEWLFCLLLVSIGWPFWVISFTAPMLQRWFSQIRHDDARDPYFLYSASNAGSLAALLGFPFLIEPYLRISQQVWIWSAGYAILVILILLCVLAVWRSPEGSTGVSPSQTVGSAGASPSPGLGSAGASPSRWGDRLRWFAFSLIPSSMLLGVTTYITTDVAAAPLLWIVPLAIYLVTFILVFARKTILPHASILNVQPYLLAPPIILFFWGSKVPLFVNFPIHLCAFFIQAMVCHGELARRRPPASHLTEFYLWMALGGVAGGLFNALIAPTIFSAPLEYPLAIAAAAMLRSRYANPNLKTWRFALGLLAGLTVLLLGPVTGNPDLAYYFGVGGLLIVSALLVAYFFAWTDRPLPLGIALALLILAGYRMNDAYFNVLHRERGFFGPLHVRMDPQENYFLFYHGTTLHGAQSRLPEERMRPLTYFTESGPFGQIMSTLNAHFPAPRAMAVTGLGAGTIAAYGRPGDAIDYYEIDPNVVTIAHDVRYFTFLADASATVTVTLGDARLTLAKAKNESYDAIVMDAFSSGSIPIHLLTGEAFAMVKSKVKKGGVLIYQISNRYLNLEPVLASFAQDAGWEALIKRNTGVTATDKRNMIYPSVWVALSAPSEFIQSLAAVPGWQPLPPTPGFTPWTDDFSNLLSAIRMPRWD